MAETDKKTVCPLQPLTKAARNAEFVQGANVFFSGRIFFAFAIYFHLSN